MSTVFSLSRQPACYDIRAELKDVNANKLEMFVHECVGWFKKHFSKRKQFHQLVQQINNCSNEYRALGVGGLRDEINELRFAIVQEGLTQANVKQSFALSRELSDRILGKRHYESQLIGGLLLLQGQVAEMETGEGKTLTATLPAIAMALAGVPVHVISVNDYLTERDAQNMRPLYEAAGLRVACVIHGLTPEERRKAYQADITYVTNKELVFDYLRDRLTIGERVDASLLQAEYLHSNEHRSKKILLRGLHFGIVDEADSILIDEARTPLIISGSEGNDEKEQFLEQALTVARELQEEDDYRIDRAGRRLRLTDKGKKEIGIKIEQYGPLWNGLVRREATIQQALTALHFYHLDQQYLVRDGKIQIIDEFTGRVMEDRSWEQGLHQLIEFKEGCELSDRRETMAKISYQRFFRRYLQLAGMTGTAKEVAGELWSVYHLTTVKVAPNKPVQRKELPSKIYSTQEEKWRGVVESIKEVNGKGRPVLVGTRSVEASETLSQLAVKAGLKHQVLNAKQDAEEAQIICQAGEKNTITIATNMAGRGTDIILGEGVKEVGGLHVIATELHEAARIDRQLAGRCGRQGDPGSVEVISSFEDILFDGRQKSFLVRIAKFCVQSRHYWGSFFAKWFIKHSQQRVEKYHADMRKELFRQDQAQGSLLSFSGRVE